MVLFRSFYEQCYNNFIFDGIWDVIIIGTAVECIRIAELASKNGALLTMVNRQKHFLVY